MSRTWSPGGADFECLLSHRELSNDSVAQVLRSLPELGVSLRPGESLLAYADDPTTPDVTATSTDIATFLDHVKRSGISTCLVLLQGKIGDVVAPISYLADLKHAVVVLSVSEDVLFGDNPKESVKTSLNRLSDFVSFCRAVAQLTQPCFVYQGTESLSPDEFTVERAEENGGRPFDAALFDRAEVEAILQWYIDVYYSRRSHPVERS